MAPPFGSAFAIKVESAVPGTYVTLNDMNKHNMNTQRSTAKFPVFSRAVPYAVVGVRERTVGWSGYFSPTDPALLLLLAAEAAGVPIKVQFLWDGAAGQTETVLISSFTRDAGADAATMQEIAFVAESTAAAVIVGTGPLM